MAPATLAGASLAREQRKMSKRFYVRASGSMWEVCDSQQGEHPSHRPIASFPMKDYGHDWNVAHAAAVAHADLLNTEGVTA
jgi:hypothetical protein